MVPRDHDKKGQGGQQPVKSSVKRQSYQIFEMLQRESRRALQMVDKPSGRCDENVDGAAAANRRRSRGEWIGTLFADERGYAENKNKKPGTPTASTRGVGIRHAHAQLLPCSEVNEFCPIAVPT